MVRLQQLFELFSPDYYSVVSLNSTMVRLQPYQEVKMFEELLKCLNSTMVRLQLRHQAYIALIFLKGLNSTMVRLQQSLYEK